MTNATQILAAALELPERERVQLAAAILDSVPNDASPADVDPALLAEVRRRRDDLHAGRTRAVPYSEVRRKLDAMIERGRQQATTG